MRATLLIISMTTLIAIPIKNSQESSKHTSTAFETSRPIEISAGNQAVYLAKPDIDGVRTGPPNPPIPPIRPPLMAVQSQPQNELELPNRQRSFAQRKPA
jgi:hypothetical protein